MLRKFAIMLVAAMTLGAASVTTPALAFRGGGGGFGYYGGYPFGYPFSYYPFYYYPYYGYYSYGR